jgi:hypothetical protein
VATVPATVPFEIGARLATFLVTAAPRVEADTPVTITATLGNVAKTATLTVRHAAVTILNLQISPDTVFSGDTAAGVITLTGNAPPGASIALSSSDPNVASVPPSVAVGGALTANFAVVAVGIGQATITATFGNSVTHVIRVVKQSKEGKEGKEGNEKLTREKVQIIEKVRQIEKIQTEFSNFTKMGDVFDNGRGPLSLANLMRVRDGNGSSYAANGRAFIRSDERPRIGPPGQSDNGQQR